MTYRGDRLEQVLVDERSFAPIEGWPSVYIKRFPRRQGEKPGVMLVIAYVDDLLFLGTHEMQAEIKAIRESINIDDPTPLRKYLGCTHNVQKETMKDGGVLTTCEYDMCDALAAAVKLFVSITGQRLKVVDSPYPPDIG